jgi:hypothetical protein
MSRIKLLENVTVRSTPKPRSNGFNIGQIVNDRLRVRVSAPFGNLKGEIYCPFN